MDKISSIDIEDKDMARLNIQNVNHNECDTCTAIRVKHDIKNHPVTVEVGQATTIHAVADYQKASPGEPMHPKKVKLHIYLHEQGSLTSRVPGGQQ